MTTLSSSVDELVAKVDALTARVEVLVDRQEADRLLSSVAAGSVRELLDDVGEIGGDVFEVAIDRLEDLRHRGYFEFAAGLTAILDRIVTSFDEDDLQALGDNVVLILETVKEMTQPEVMRMLQRTARILRDDEEPEKLSLFRLLREMRDPEVKLGLHRMLTVLRGLASEDMTSDSTVLAKEMEE
ncbi:MAG TPA: DUF1641 domain-containing protein [Acidimicrobiia bacterium]|nr:DUF1641 domain-containing protein [Acidimicrobiia bacterium]